MTRHAKELDDVEFRSANGSTSRTLRREMNMTRLLVTMFVACAAATAQGPSKVLVATAKEAITEIASPGTITCIGGAPSNNPQALPCSPGTKRVLVSYRVSRAAYQEIAGSAADLIKGQVETVVHCNLDADYYGHCWGHFVWTVPGAGGVWEGVWGGPHDLLTNVVSYTAVGFGVGGKLEGLQLKWEAAYTGPGPGFGIATIHPLVQPQ
jgi:hypothetical protein